MISVSLNLPKRYRLNLRFEKRRGRSLQTHAVKDLIEFVNKRGGTKVSRFMRFVFDKYSIKNLIGANLVFLSIASSLLDLPTTNLIPSDNVEIVSPVILTTKRGVRVPLEAQNVTQGYWALHRGVDLNGETGDHVYPVSGGVVDEAGFSSSGYGNMVIINHKNGYKSLYAHLSKIDVQTGQEVNNETKIGEVGSTGRSFGDHLHLEIYENEVPINPMTILPK